MENARELDGVVYSGLAEFSIRYRPRIGTEAKDRGGLARKRLRERGAVREVRMLNLCQLWVRETELPAAESRSHVQRRGGPAHSEGRSRRPFPWRPRSQD